MSEVDLVIRTSGEKRVSNFLLWQAAYAEFIFLDLCWPEFEPKHFREAVEEYGARERRFGGIGKNPVKSAQIKEIQKEIQKELVNEE